MKIIKRLPMSKVPINVIPGAIDWVGENFPELLAVEQPTKIAYLSRTPDYLVEELQQYLPWSQVMWKFQVTSWGKAITIFHIVFAKATLEKVLEFIRPASLRHLCVVRDDYTFYLNPDVVIDLDTYPRKESEVDA